uniref:Glycine rich superfamily member n=1 Tax=Rhipicephalus appendiculatus TaxID=34631 RepID=A0A131YCL1_RHIAP
MKAFVSIAIALVIVAQSSFAQRGDPRWFHTGPILGWPPQPVAVPYIVKDLPRAKIPTDYPPSTVRPGMYFLASKGWPKDQWTHRPGPF